MFKKLSIVTQLCLMAVSIVLIIVTIYYYSYIRISDSMVKSNINYAADMFQQVNNVIEQNTVLLENMMQSVGYGRNVLDYLRNTDDSATYVKMKELDSIIFNLNGIKSEITDVIILGKNGKRYYSNGMSQQLQRAVADISDSPINEYSLSYKFTGDSVLNANATYLIMGTSIYNIWDTASSDFLGKMAIVVDMRIFGIEDACLPYDMGLYLVDNNGGKIHSANREPDVAVTKIISDIQGERQGESERVIDGEKYVVKFTTIEKLHSKLLSVTPKKKILNSVSWIKKGTFFILAGVMMLFSILFLFLIKNTTRPLYAFKHFMAGLKDKETGGTESLKERISLDGYKEIREISDEFNNMFDEIDSLTHSLMNTTASLYELELEKKQAELSYLKSQIDPHFLYNTLEVIIGMSMEEGAEHTADMIICLSRIFKYSIRGEDKVTLRQEMEIINAYLHIQKTRFGELFEVEYALKPEAMDRTIPKMILQPLVENALRHGIEQKECPGRLFIGGDIIADSLLLVVQDDGVGMDEEMLEYVRSTVNGRPADREMGIGVYNVSHRLRLIYGDNCRISVASTKDSGTRFEILIP